MSEIKNVRITRDSIKYVVNLLNDRRENFLKLFEKQKEDEQSGIQEIINQERQYVVSGAPSLTFEVTINGVSDTRSDINWFLDCLMNKPKQLEKIFITYSAYYVKNSNLDNYIYNKRSEEYINISFRNDSVYYSCSKENPLEDFEFILDEINKTIINAPPRYDDTLAKKSRRENVPSLNVGLGIGFFITLILFGLFKFDFIDYGLKQYVVSKYFVPLMLFIWFLIGLLIPGKNHALYRKLKLRQKYIGYNSTKKKSITTDDVNDIINNCEVEIGEYYNHGDIRKEIEKNYAKSKVILLIEIILFAAFSVVSIVL